MIRLMTDAVAALTRIADTLDELVDALDPRRIRERADAQDDAEIIAYLNNRAQTTPRAS